MIICIGRAFGSGGHEIGKELAKNLGLDFYDNELLENAAVKNNIGYKALKKADEKKANAFLHAILYEAEEKELRGLSANDILFRVQSKMILKAAAEGDCVFVGRCADHVLTQNKIEHISLFITAPFSERVKRKRELLGLEENEAVKLVQKSDKQRKAYYNYYSGREWGKAHNYDLCINSAKLGVDETAKALSCMLKNLDELYMLLQKEQGED